MSRVDAWLYPRAERALHGLQRWTGVPSMRVGRWLLVWLALDFSAGTVSWWFPAFFTGPTVAVPFGVRVLGLLSCLGMVMAASRDILATRRAERQWCVSAWVHRQRYYSVFLVSADTAQDRRAVLWTVGALTAVLWLGDATVGTTWREWVLGLSTPPVLVCSAYALSVPPLPPGVSRIRSALRRLTASGRVLAPSHAQLAV